MNDGARKRRKPPRGAGAGAGGGGGGGGGALTGLAAVQGVFHFLPVRLGHRRLLALLIRLIVVSTHAVRASVPSTTLGDIAARAANLSAWSQLPEVAIANATY